MRYINKKNGCIVDVRDDKKMDEDWEPYKKAPSSKTTRKKQQPKTE